MRYRMKHTLKFKRDDYKSLLRLTETVLELLIFSLIYYRVWDDGYDISYFDYRGKYVLMGLYAFILNLFFQYSDSTKFSQLHRTDLIIGQIISLALTNFITYLQLSLVANRMLSPMPMLSLLGVECGIAAVLVLLFTWLYYKLYAPHDMLLIYGDERGTRIKNKLDTRLDKYKICGVISTEVGMDAICAEIGKYEAIVLSDLSASMRNDILKYCFDKGVRVYLSPKLSDIILRGAKNITLFDTPLLLVKGNGLTFLQRFIKRGMDIVLGVIGLVVASPVMLLVAAAIKLEDGGPVFFRQDRLTIHGREFQILKFRSMVTDAEKYSGAVLAADRDPRITKVGRFIRATRLDELPQIINIIKGDMSIVGPRPERKVIAEEYYRDTPEFAYRLKVRAGLTGYAQIYGKYNTIPYDKLRLDLIYINNYSVLLDIQLIVLTLRILFSKDSTEGVEISEKHQKQEGSADSHV